MLILQANTQGSPLHTLSTLSRTHLHRAGVLVSPLNNSRRVGEGVAEGEERGAVELTCCSSPHKALLFKRSKVQPPAVCSELNRHGDPPTEH